MKKRKRRIHNGASMVDLEKSAKRIVETGKIQPMGNNRFLAPSESEEAKYYEVCFLDDWTCTCPYHKNRHTDCKHIIAVQIIVMKITDIKPVDITLQAPPIKCTIKECASSNCRYYQSRPRKKGGVSHRYKCTDCKNRFTFRPGFLGRHYSEDVITHAIDDVINGKSCNATSRGIKIRSYSGVKKPPVGSTIQRWVDDANKSTSKIPQNIPLPVSDMWSTDEIFARTAARDTYHYDIMDEMSRFVIASDISPDEKLDYDATPLFEDAIITVEKICRVLISDKLRGYKWAFDNTIDKKGRRRPKFIMSYDAVYHIRAACIRKHHINNNKRERLNGIIKDRIKTVRGFNSKDPALLGLLLTFYNFIRPHMGLNGITPAEKLGIKIAGVNKWMTLLAYASTL